MLLADGPRSSAANFRLWYVLVCPPETAHRDTSLRDQTEALSTMTGMSNRPTSASCLLVVEQSVSNNNKYQRRIFIIKYRGATNRQEVDMPLKRFSPFLAVCFTLAVSLALTVPQLHAQGDAPIFTTIDVPGAVETDANDVNTAGTVVGFSVDSAGIATGFSLSNGTFTSIAFPGATHTLVYGINDGGVTVGWYVDSAGISHGFKRSASGSKTATIDPPGSTRTNAWSINNSGTIVGTYVDSAGFFHGFTLAGGTYTTFDAPGSNLTEFTGVNSAP